MPAGQAPASASERARAQRLLEGVVIAVFAAALAWCAVGLAADLPEDRAELARLLLAIALGLLTADLVSGLVHFTCDVFFHERTPVIGRVLIAPFRDHHRDPKGITRHGFLERNGNNCLGGGLLLGCGLVLGEPPSPAWHAYLLAMAFALAATNQIHSWAHAESPPRLVRGLQRAGLLLSPAMHAEHHNHAHDRAYCITTGWLNPVLDRVRAFARLERLVRALGRPRAKAR